MASQVLPVKVGQMELLVEVTPLAGTEMTSRTTDAAANVMEAFGQVKDAIVEVAASTVEVIERTAKRSARPDHLEVQFGLKIAASGNIIVAGVSGEATITVKLVYDAQRSAVDVDTSKLAS